MDGAGTLKCWYCLCLAKHTAATSPPSGWFDGKDIIWNDPPPPPNAPSLRLRYCRFQIFVEWANLCAQQLSLHHSTQHTAHSTQHTVAAHPFPWAVCMSLRQPVCWMSWGVE